MWNLMFVLATLLPTHGALGQGAALLPASCVSADAQGAGSGQQAAPAKPGAQQSPKSKPEKDDQEQAKPDDQNPPPARKPIRLPHSLLTVDFSYADWTLGGNAHKFRQYATPPVGFFAREVTVAPRPSSRDYGFLTLRGPGEIDYRNDAAVSLNYGRTM